jgi:transmembrane sensor
MDRFSGMMKLVYSVSKAKARTLDDEAMTWVVRLTSGESSPADNEAFRRWRDQDPEHLEALKRARALWQKLGSALPEVESRRDRSRRRAGMLKWSAAVAASLVLGTLFSFYYWTIGRFAQVTAIGERRTVSLTDGSEIVMSGDTALNVISGHGVRRVELARGEILVRARHDPAIPFVVHAGEARFRDVGTVFDVSLAGGGTQLVVLEGTVEVSKGDRRLLVDSDQAVAVDGTLGVVRAADAHAETAWVSGRLIFKNKTLPQILAALAPHYRGHIALLKSGTDGPLLTGTVDLDHIDEWLTALAQMQGLHATHIGGFTFLT